MKNEIKRLEKELLLIDEKLKKVLQDESLLLKDKLKKQHDIRVLKTSLGIPIESKETQTSLIRLMKK